jgi:hypothetical protein
MDLLGLTVDSRSCLEKNIDKSTRRAAIGVFDHATNSKSLVGTTPLEIPQR